MAEEKKFLNEEMEQSNHKLMVKYIALSVVIFVILILCVLAWFTSKTEANASGLTIKATADNGLQVAITDHKVVTEDGNTVHKNEWTSFAYQQTYHSSFTSTNRLPLISGDGLQFFEPSFVKVAENYTDKLDIDVLDSAGQVSWFDVTNVRNDITHEKAKYIEYKLKFRNDKKSNVFLTSDSKVTPDSSADYDPLTYDKNLNQSNFSKNFISATARIAFLNKVTEGNTEALNLHNLWIPNDDIELTHTDRTEKDVITYEEQSPEGTVKKVAGSSAGIPSGGTATNYYVWWNGADIFSGGQRDAMVTYYNNMPNYKSPLMDAGDYYYCKMHAPETGTSAEGDRAFFVTTGDTVSLESRSNGMYIGNKFDLIGTSVSKQYVDSEGTYVTVQFMSDDYNIAYQKNADNDYGYIMNCEKVYVSPHKGELDYYLIIDKDGTVKDIVLDDGLGGTEPSYSVDINKNVYVPEDGDVLLISADNGSNNYGLSSILTSAVSVGMSPSGAGHPTWTVTGATSSGSFKLQDVTSGKYLSVTEDGLSLSDTGTELYAVTKYEETVSGTATTTNLKGVMLYTLDNNCFVNFNGSKFTASSDFDTTYTYHIYKQKSELQVVPGSWGILTKRTAPQATTESTFYYRKVDPADENKTVKRQLTNYILSDDLDDIPTEYTPTVNMTTYPNFIVSIGGEKDSNGFYVSDEITVRIWGEGYDREAQTPLQGGWMNVDLHFFAVEE
ncbi:MAG: hypothetical protein ACI4HZ_09090 [Ruminococcus sp.]